MTWRALRKAQHNGLRAMGRSNATALFSRLLRNGLRPNALGIDFTLLQAVRHAARPQDLRTDADARAAFELLIATPDAVLERSSAPRVLWELDQPARIAPCALGEASVGSQTAPPADRASGMLYRMRRDGFALVEDWGAGLDLAALREQVEAALHAEAASRHGGKAPPVLLTRAALPALLPLLHDEAIARALRGYLGGPVRYDGHASLRLSEGVNTANYVSGHWHHDRCGRRVKLFVFLHDVHGSGRPTVIARASHDTLYFSHADPWRLLSRFRDSYVRRHYRVVPMLGRAGGGFVFDTNALHMGLVEGNASRTVVILEFHRHGKVASFARLNNPCPSAKPGRAASKAQLRHGVGGLRLYPKEGKISAS